jgi:predicted Zn-ribbon and HTH transcriptional regulator
MEKVTFLLAVAMVAVLMAAPKVDVKKAAYVKIRKNLSKSHVLKVQKEALAKGYAFVVNPKFGCKDAGFSKTKDLYSGGVLYGKRRADGSIDISGVGDFKAYRFENYIQERRQCNLRAYTKEYDPKRYGKYSYALLMMHE